MADKGVFNTLRGRTQMLNDLASGLDPEEERKKREEEAKKRELEEQKKKSKWRIW